MAKNKELQRTGGYVDFVTKMTGRPSFVFDAISHDQLNQSEVSCNKLKKMYKIKSHNLAHTSCGLKHRGSSAFAKISTTSSLWVPPFITFFCKSPIFLSRSLFCGLKSLPGSVVRVNSQPKSYLPLSTNQINNFAFD